MSAPTTTEASRYSLDDFVAQTSQKDLQQGVFELENRYTLEVNLNGRVWSKTGAMVAYQGEMRFRREGAFEHGFLRWLKRVFTGEGTRLSSIEGRGRVYLADAAKRVTLLRLANEAVSVSGKNILAFEDTVRWDIRMMRSASSLLAGGLFNVRFEGTGLVALTSHGQPLTLMVTPDSPVVTDPNATIAWSGDLVPELRTDISARTFLGRGGGEAFQLVFRGQGFVVIQPYEEKPMADARRAGG